MSDKYRDLGNESQLKAPDRFAKDLKGLYEPEGRVPAEVDRAVMDRVNRHFVRRRPRRLFRWIGPAAAAAAVIVFAVILNGTKKGRLDDATAPALDVTKERSLTLAQSASGVGEVDVDGSGRVDILDAFKLARHIKSGGRPEMKWDINGDGVVNSKDVDLLAFAAVRLDKGVL